MKQKQSPRRHRTPVATLRITTQEEEEAAARAEETMQIMVSISKVVAIREEVVVAVGGTEAVEEAEAEGTIIIINSLTC